MSNRFNRRALLQASLAGAAGIAAAGVEGAGEPSPPFYEEPARRLPIVETADVLVCGAGPAGVAAAVAAARAGAVTRLIEVHGCLGGVWTAGLLSWILDCSNKGGLMGEIVAGLKQRKAARTYSGDGSGAVGYDCEKMKIFLEDLSARAGVRVRLHTRVAAAVVEKDARLRLAITESKSGRQAFAAKVFIDASGDGDLAAQAGCRFDYGHNGRAQPMSLMAILAGLDPEQAAPYVRGLAEPRGEKQPKLRFREEIRKGGVDPSYAGPTLFCLPGNLFAMMANHEYGVAGTNADELTAATLRARAEVHAIADALRRRGGVWKDLVIVATAEQIGVREGRRIHGRYRVTTEDLSQGAQHADAVCRVTFGVDVHSPDPKREKGIARQGVRAKPYDIPYRALIASDADNLLLAGRCISGDFIAHSSYRVTGNAVAMGEAAGAAAALAAQSGRAPKDIPWVDVQKQLQRKPA